MTNKEYARGGTPIKICIMATVPSIINSFYGNQIDFLVDRGFDVTVVTSPDQGYEKAISRKAHLILISIARKVSLFKDILAMARIFNCIRAGKFDIVQYSSPKAALLGSIAAWACRIKVRLYLMWGLYYTGQKGFNRIFLKCVEKAICFFSTHISPDSKGNMNFAINEKLCPVSKISVVGNGSANGVDLLRFDPQRLAPKRVVVRSSLNIPQDAMVIGFVGRLRRDKGLGELLKAFIGLMNKYQKLYMVLIGPDESGIDEYGQETGDMLRKEERIICVGRQEHPEDYMAAMDIFTLPSYREGFGIVNIEASAMELPVISTDIPGPRDAVLNGKTGILIRPGSAEDLQRALETMIGNNSLRREMGLAGREWAKHFEQRSLWEEIVTHRTALLGKKDKFNYGV